MNLFTRPATALLLSFGLAMGTAATMSAAEGGWYQDYPAPYGDLRGLIDRTQTDLRTASELEHGKEKQRDRYHNTQGHLSTFDRKLTHGHFDKGELDKSINGLREILDHNVLQVSSRDALMHDMTDLKIARDRRW